MRFGVNLLSQHTADRSQHDLYREMLEQATVAEELGFDALFLNEHHPFDRTEELWLQPLPALAGLATRTSRIALGTNILVLPLYHPLRMAEDVAMIHAMSGGRFVLGVGIGYKAEEFEAYGVPLRQRVSRFEEQVEILRRVWGETKVAFHGRHFAFTSVSLPVQTFVRPAPPIWIGAEVNPAIARAARLGDAWLPERAGKCLDDLERPLMRETFVLEDARQARETFAPYVLQKYREYWRSGAPQLRAEFVDDAFTFEQLCEDRFIVGGPEEAIRQIERHRAELGITHLIFRVQKKGMPHRDVLRVLRVLAERVLPSFRERSRSRADA